MRKVLSYIIMWTMALLLWASCTSGPGENPYEGTLYDLIVDLEYPEGYKSEARAGVSVKVEDINKLVNYSTTTMEGGKAMIQLPCGLYRITVSDRVGRDIFNGTADRLVLNSASRVSLPLVYSKAGTLLIKEIYCGGCNMYPQVGNYQSDQYIILHNNDTQISYLDSLCFGTLAPYNSNSSNPWGGVAEKAPIIQALWQFGGTGESFPLAPGEDAVLCLRGAIDHTVQYPLSVNLNHEDYFVCYNTTYFTNPAYHPAPGDKIRPERYLDVVIKTGQANAYTFSINSPTVIIFRPEGISAKEFVRGQGNVVNIPGSSIDRVVMIPWEWIIDGVEVFNGSTASNSKRIRGDVDAGYVTLSETFQGHSLVRIVDSETSAANGFEVLHDTNNSSEDFIQAEKASLYHEK